MSDLRVSLMISIVLAATGCSTPQTDSLVQPNLALRKTIQTPGVSLIQAEQFSPSPEKSDPENQIVLVSDEVESTTPAVEPQAGNVFLVDDSDNDVNDKELQLSEEELQLNEDTPPLNITELSDFDQQTIAITDVITSVHASYPLLAAALLENSIADGKQLATWGAFDTKLKSASQNGPLGFYETYRQDIGFSQPIYSGGEVFGGYRIGRGFFQPWYLERQTNDGGEFKAGFRIPLLKNRDIDTRRADLWRATYQQQRVRPEVRAQLILFVREASITYWAWIAAGQKYEIWKQALDVSLDRNEKLKKRVELGDLDPPALKDNQRSIATRESKLIDRGRKLQQAAVKLSLFYRSADGAPIIPDRTRQGAFPEPIEFFESEMNSDIQIALAQRPELVALAALSREINVDLAEARNEFLPQVDAFLANSQDVGKPTSSKRDKSRYEIEASVFIDVPLQRRKARGKSHAAEAKLSQVAVKRRFTEDKIAAEVQSAYAGLIAAYNRVSQAREAKRLAEFMAEVENRRFELGQSDLLAVYLREQAAIEAADGEVDSLLEYYIAKANYSAALAIDWPVLETQ